MPKNEDEKDVKKGTIVFPREGTVKFPKEPRSNKNGKKEGGE